MGFQQSFNERVIPAGDRAFGELATLSHGPATTEAFTAVWEQVTYEVVDGEGFLTRFSGRHFMFPVTAAAIAGEAFEPRAGDRITFQENGVSVEYELLPVGNLPAVELMPGGFRWRARAKKVG